MNEPNPTNPVPICDLLNKLPVEVRLDIYKFSFEGSRVQASLAKKIDSPSAPHDGGLILRPSKHFNLLLTCRTIYNEAMDTYWSETVLHLKCPPQLFGSLRAFDHVKLKLDTYAHTLCTSLPEAAKANVKHVRGMVLPALGSLWVKKNPTLTTPALLGMFKNLATCDMTASLSHPIDGLLLHYDDPEDESYSRFEMTSGAKPSEFLSARYGELKFGEIAFFFKGRVKNSVRMDEDGVERVRVSKTIRPLFWNFSTGIAFEDMTGKMDDEEDYRKVLKFDM